VAETVLFCNCRVLASPDAQWRSGAILVREGRVAALGETAELRALAGPKARKIDLRGAYLYPGFHDCHCHLLQYGRTLRQVDLRSVRSFAEVVELCRKRAEELGPGRWVLGRGYDDERWGDSFPGHRPLSQATPQNPVLLTRTDGHAAIANAAALALAGITRHTPDPPDGRIQRMANGEPSGVLLDSAKWLVERHVPQDDRATLLSDLRAALARLVALGLTCVHDMSCDAQTRELCTELAQKGELVLRVQGYAPAGELDELEGPGEAVAHGLVRVRGVKLFVDGALGSRGAALFEPYCDDPANCGVLHCSEEELCTRLTIAASKGLQPAIHAIGDRANHIALNAIERARSSGAHVVRPRIEHAQVLRPADLERLAPLGVIASMQFRHATSDMLWAEARLGRERARLAYAWGAVRRQGVRIAGGSDFPVEPPAPVADFYAAITRQDPSGEPPQGWFPENRLSRRDALRALTADAAFAALAEGELGAIKPQNRADFTVLDSDLLAAPAPEILNACVVATIVGGTVVYSSL